MKHEKTESGSKVKMNSTRSPRGVGCSLPRPQAVWHAAMPLLPWPRVGAMARPASKTLLRWIPRPHPLPTAPLRSLCSSMPTSMASTAPTAAAKAQPLVADLPAPATRFAVVHLSGSQYKVSPDDLICTERLMATRRKHIPVGTTIQLRRVLLVGEADVTVIGSPLIKGASVEATVEEQGYGHKCARHSCPRRPSTRCQMPCSPHHHMACLIMHVRLQLHAR